MRIFNKKNKFWGLIAVCFVVMFSFQTVSTTNLNNSANVNAQKNPKISAEITGTMQWLNNTGFNTTDYWYKVVNTDQASPDVNGTIDTNKALANFTILGEKFQKQVILDASTQLKWHDFLKTEDQLAPNNGYGIDDDGCYCSHYWYDGDPGQTGDGADQTPVMYWRTNVSMDIDMSDYEITSASLEAIMNASVDPNIDVESDTNSRFSPTYTLNQRATYDFAQFFIETADMEVTKLNTYELAFNQTLTLGEESSTNYDIEGHIETKNEQAIIDSITNVLSVDPGHDNFTLISGIYIYSADNYDNYDYDFWDDLRIKYVNLTFEYEKKIDLGNSVAWNQDGNNVSSISPYRVVPTGANLKFQYKIDKNWTEYTSSQNSELNIYLNGNPYPIPIKLIDVNDTVFKWAELVLPKPSTDEFLNLSIELLIKDEFGLDQQITLSIDNVTLDISYIIYAPNPPVAGEGGGGGGTKIIRGEDYTPVVIGLIAGIIGLVAVFGAYQAHFKHPPMVRKIRKLKKKIKKGKTLKSLIVNPRDEIIRDNFKAKTRHVLDEEFLQSEIPGKINKINKKGGK
ncbi:MAG: hypothetical protein ACFFHV_22040 [Promethearchaeota archaeon]